MSYFNLERKDERRQAVCNNGRMIHKVYLAINLSIDCPS
jgi:hypothetical protein